MRRGKGDLRGQQRRQRARRVVPSRRWRTSETPVPAEQLPRRQFPPKWLPRRRRQQRRQTAAGQESPAHRVSGNQRRPRGSVQRHRRVCLGQQTAATDRRRAASAPAERPGYSPARCANGRVGDAHAASLPGAKKRRATRQDDCKHSAFLDNRHHATHPLGERSQFTPLGFALIALI